MKSEKPIIQTDFINTRLPYIKGTCSGFNVINVYNHNFSLVKSVTEIKDKFVINIEDVIVNNAFVLTAIESGKEESDYSKILTKKL